MSKALVSFKDISPRDQKQIKVGVSFVLATVVAAYLAYLIPFDYDYSHSGLTLVLTVLAIVLIIRTRARNLKTKQLGLGSLANTAGTTAMVNFLAGSYFLFLALKALIGILTSEEVVTSVFTRTIIEDPLLPAALLSTILLRHNTDNAEAAKLSDWAWGLMIVAVLFGVLFHFILLTPNFIG